jgi:hypothetical protein
MLAHGAGAPMDSDFMQAMAGLLCERTIEVVRFEFPYMAARRSGGGKRPPERAPVLLDCWRAQVAECRSRSPAGRSLLIGGKSLGGRMASMLADELGVDGLVCLGYPFHPPRKSENLRTGHLAALQTPTLIVQGTRDALGSQEEVAEYPLAPGIRVHWLADGDHDLKPRLKSGFTHRQHLISAAAAIADFIDCLVEGTD